ncbi:MAG: hypothetical protein ACYS4W_02395 [Planctomycetota bacterium]
MTSTVDDSWNPACDISGPGDNVVDEEDPCRCPDNGLAGLQAWGVSPGRV